jgi:hypothetical protein
MTYPPNGTVTNTYETTTEVEVKMKGLIISSSVLMVIFAVAAIIFLVLCKRQNEEEDLIDNEIRNSIVDLETNEGKDGQINPSS